MLDKLWKFLTGSSDEKTTATAGKNSSEQSRAAAPVSRAPGPWRAEQPAQQQQIAPRQMLSPTRGWAPAQGTGVQPPRLLSPTRGWAYDEQAQAAQYKPPVGGRSNQVIQAEQQKTQDGRNDAANQYAQMLGNERVEVEEMSWEDYSALTPRQRAAVDINSELLEAVNADKADPAAKVTPEYTKMSEKLFGKDRGSDTVAPRTVALLSELGHDLTTNAPQDLDQYLGLQALVGSDDLRFLTDEGADEAKTGETLTNVLTTGKGLGDPSNAARYGEGGVNARAENATRLATAAQTRLSQSLVAGQSLIGKLRTDSDLGARLFGDPTTSVGFNPALERDQVLQSIFDTMARKDATFADGELAEALGTFNEEFGLDNDQLLQFFETRLKASEYGNSPVGTDSTGQYLNPAEFRARYYNGDN